MFGFTITTRSMTDARDHSGPPCAWYYFEQTRLQYPELTDASGFVDGLLLGPAGTSGDSVVEPTAWGRIKASLD